MAISQWPGVLAEENDFLNLFCTARRQANGASPHSIHLA